VHVAPVDEQESEDDFFEVDEEVDSTEENEEETQARQLTGSLDAEDFPVDESEEERQRDDPPLFDNETDENEARIGRDVRAEFRTDVTFEEIIGALLMLKTCHTMPWSLFLSIVSFLQALLVTECKLLPKTHEQLKKFFREVVGVQTNRVVFCRICEEIAEILPDMLDKPSAVIFCRKCGHDVATDAKEGKGNFVWLPSLPQLSKYVKRGKLYEVMRDFKDTALEIFRGDKFKGVLQRGNVPVLLGSDAAPLGKNTGKSVYPIVMALGNIPNRLVQSYAVLCAVFVGKKEDEPPASVFYDLTLREIDSFEQKKIRWSRTEEKSLELVSIGGDQPELRKLANQSTQGYKSCVYCLERGYWDGGAVRFGYKRHLNPQEERTPAKRYRAAATASRLNEDKNSFQHQERVSGIMGYPIQKESASFYGSFSYVCDLMHVVLLGFLKDLIFSICSGVGKAFNLRRSHRKGFKG
jgi:hypothetical protein